ncbi:glycerophosphodiester phosphodiesterase [Shewanella insulae]|uniref:glycerophosphodiester phosphodiesterase n=1 Tax=Shewanella insulae TaxID=2681496 RepID=UPI001EFD01C8|nr:glycerophosphodiester phosphodiesterase family protein [Shewanella insulae]MCG9755392.1 glycerophosphodiester phosphodiesterase [Shewanella insulae]
MRVYAHRGASGYGAENTLAAIKKSVALGCNAVEIDVHSVEGELYVFHDRRLDGKSTGTGLIEAVTQEYLARVTVDGEPIPKLWELLEYLQPFDALINIELKGLNSIGPFMALYPEILEKLNYRGDQLLISSFHHGFLFALRQAFPDAKLAPLIEGVPEDMAAIVTRLQAFSLHLSVNFVTRELVQDAHARGAKVFVYTVDNRDDIHYLSQMGVDGIFSNFPDVSADCVHQLLLTR